jgi:hypothetical protein
MCSCHIFTLSFALQHYKQVVVIFPVFSSQSFMPEFYYLSYIRELLPRSLKLKHSTANSNSNHNYNCLLTNTSNHKT